jgi:hypothetical protein
MTRQTLRSYSDIAASLPKATNKFVADYSAMKDDILKALKGVDSLSPQFGTGSPEGVVTANLSQTYYDTTNSPTNVTMYINENVGSNTGWVVVA